MINIQIGITNYFLKYEKYYEDDLYFKTKSLTKNKFFYVSFTKSIPSKFLWFEIDLNWRNTSHAGPSIELQILHYSLRIGIEDLRHWNTKDNIWYKLEDSN